MISGSARAQNMEISSFFVKKSGHVPRAGNAPDLSILRVGTTRAGVVYICAALPCAPRYYCTFHSAHVPLIDLPHYGTHISQNMSNYSILGPPSSVSHSGVPRLEEHENLENAYFSHFWPARGHFKCPDLPTPTQ